MIYRELFKEGGNGRMQEDSDTGGMSLAYKIQK